jgi:hypothetical protein
VGPIVYTLHVPGIRRELRVIMPVPDVLFIAWHRDAEGIFEVLNQDGRDNHGYVPQNELWRLVAYGLVEGGPEWGWGRYEALLGREPADVSTPRG